MTAPRRLGVNIDHVATIRNARGGAYPDPIRAALVAQEAGADGITAHLREDRRHISDDDIAHLIGAIAFPLNMEMAATEEMVALALKHRPPAACIVPERPEEVTTDGGLNPAGQHNHSLFLDRAAYPGPALFCRQPDPPRSKPRPGSAPQFRFPPAFRIRQPRRSRPPSAASPRPPPWR